MSAAPETPVTHFGQTDLLANRVMFVHDGSTGDSASFDVVVADETGGTSGAPETVHVAVF